MIRTVEAQSPNAVGCWQGLNPTGETCYCEGLPGPGVIDSFTVPGFGTGTTGAIEVPATCEVAAAGCPSSKIVPQFNYFCTTPTPTPTPDPPPVGGCGGVPIPNGSCSSGFVATVYSGGLCHRSQTFQNLCAEPTYYDWDTCTCPDGTTGGSPVLIDVDGGGFHLTSAADGVDFDLLAVGFTQHFSWTAAGSTNAFLVLDRNGNGTIDNGEELFGNRTPQPESSEANGFLALAEYDKITLGGNDDGKINSQDVIYPMLQLWQDTNHNGISEAFELNSLPEFGVTTIELRYKESKRMDEFGNRFLYRAKVRNAQGQQVGRWAWDVFFVMQP